jgi:hypothetical protein
VKAVRTSETLVYFYKATSRNIPEDIRLHSSDFDVAQLGLCTGTVMQVFICQKTLWWCSFHCYI